MTSTRRLTSKLSMNQPSKVDSGLLWVLVNVAITWPQAR